MYSKANASFKCFNKTVTIEQAITDLHFKNCKFSISHYIACSIKQIIGLIMKATLPRRPQV